MTRPGAAWRDGRWAARAAFAMLAASLLLGMLVPIYTDEIGWRFQARFVLDGADRFLAEHCGASTIAVPPLFMWPMRGGQALLDLAMPDPRFVRVLGVAVAAAGAALVWRLAGAVARAPEQRPWLRALAAAMLGLGVLPLLLVWSRPEQSLLLFALLALLAAAPVWSQAGRDTGARESWLRAAAVLALGAAALSIHPKGVLLVPLFALLVLLAGRGRESIVPRIASGALLAACAVSALRYWVERFRCPGDALTAARLADQNIAAALAAPGPLAAKLAAVDWGGLSPIPYVRRTLPGTRYGSDWLPGGLVDPGLLAVWRPAVDLCWKLALLLALAAAARAGVDAVRVRRVEPRLAIGLALLATVMAWGVSQAYRNGYEAALMLPLLVLAVLFLIGAAPSRQGRARLALPVAAGAAAGVALASQALLIATHAAPLVRIAARPGPIAEQRVSFTAFGYPGLRREIAAAGRLCGIGPETRPRAPLVDDITYFAYLRSERPLHRLGVIEQWNGAIADPAAYLRGKRSRGIVMACDYLPAGLRAEARQAGRFCCVGPLSD